MNGKSWAAGSLAPGLISEGATRSTGSSALDQALGGGWPLGAITELTYAVEGIGELRLLLPALVSATMAQLWAAWVAAPHTPYAPALQRAGVQMARVLVVEAQTSEDRCWALERCLQSSECGVTLFWTRVGGTSAWRRLQRAAEWGGGIGIWLHQGGHDPDCVAALRLRVDRTREGGTAVYVAKRRHGWPVGPIPVMETFR